MNQPSVKDVFQMIDAALKHDIDKTKGKNGVYQFNITGSEEGIYQMIIDENGARAVEGIEKDANVSLTLKDEHFRKLVEGSLNPTAAFMTGKLKIKGNMGLALQLQSLLNSFSF